MAQVIRDPGLRLLLEAGRRRQLRHTGQWAVGIAVIGVLNLFICAYLERFLGAGLAGDGFLILLAAESFFLLLTGAAVVAGELESIARSARVLPLTARSRFDFIFLSLIRHRAVLMVAGTALFAVGAIGPPAPASVTGRVLLVALLELMLLAGLATITVLRTRPGASARSALALLGLATAGIIIAAVVSAPGPVLRTVLPLRWVLDGAVAIQSGHPFTASKPVLWLFLSTVICIVIGRRYA
jgi:hypothetical protein